MGTVEIASKNGLTISQAGKVQLSGVCSYDGNRTWGIAYILENTKMNKAKIEEKLEGFVDI